MRVRVSFWLLFLAPAVGRPACGDLDRQAANAGFSLLFYAANKGAVDCVRTLVDGGGADLEALDNGNTPLFQAAIMGRADVVDALLAAGATVGADLVPWVSAGGAVHAAQVAQQREVYVAAREATLGRTMTDDERARLAPSATPSADESDFARVLVALAAHGAAVDARSVDGMDRTNLVGAPGIVVAARHGKTTLVRTLVTLGADVGASSDAGLTAVHAAVETGATDALAALLALERVGCAAKTVPGGATPAVLAVVYGRTKALALLAKRGNCDLDAVDGNGETAAHIAARDGKWRMLKLLGLHGANLDAGLPQDAAVADARAALGAVAAAQLTPAFFAAEANRAKALEVLHAFGVPLVGSETDARAALDVAVQFGSLDALRAIAALEDVCERKAPLADRGPNMVYVAASMGRADSLRVLVAAGCPVNATRSHGRAWSPAQTAVVAGYADVLAVLADAGADIDAEVEGVDFPPGYAAPRLVDLAVAHEDVLEVFADRHRAPSYLWEVAADGALVRNETAWDAARALKNRYGPGGPEF